MSNLRPPSQNFDPRVISRGKALDQIRTAGRNEYNKVLDVHKRPVGDYLPVNTDWLLGHSTKTQFDNVYKQTNKVRDEFKQLYPFTYPIPEEKKFNVIRRYTDEQGQARLLDGTTTLGDNTYGTPGYNPVLGQVYLGPEYFEFVQKEMEREEAMAFKAYIFNNMDISTPLKKEYWKKKNPELFQELIDALKLRRMVELEKDLIALEGPQGEEDFRAIYAHFVRPDLYAKPLNATESFPPQLPTTSPFPQGAITDPLNPDPNFRRNKNEFNNMQV